MKQVLALISALFITTQVHAAVSAIEMPVNPDSKWWFSGFSLANVEGQDMQDGGNSWFAYNYLSASYRFDYGKFLSFRLPFMYNSAGFNDFDGDVNQEQEVLIHDFLIDYTDNNLGMLPGDIEVYGRFRIGLPTSKSSNDQKTLGTLRTDFIFNKVLAPRVELEWWPIFEWHMHTQTAYLNEFGTYSNTKSYELNHRLTLWRRLKHNVAIGWFVGGEDAWYNRSKNNSTTRQTNNRMSEHLLKTGPAVRFSLAKNISFIFNLANKTQLWGYAPDRTHEISDLGKFNAEQVEFTLLTFVGF